MLPAELTGYRRDRAVVQGRHVALVLAVILTGKSRSHISARMGYHEHSTVSYVCDKFERLANKLRSECSLDDPIHKWAARAAQLYPPRPRRRKRWPETP
jgi:chromosomal replication initiation ATPase DnaA